MYAPDGDPPAQSIEGGADGRHKVAVLEVEEEILTLCFKLVQLICGWERGTASKHSNMYMSIHFMHSLVLD